MKSKLYDLTCGGVIAAMYVALTWISSLFGLSFGAVQFRISEALCILPLFTPAAIPGLVTGCIIANISSPFGLIDIFAGSAATLASCICIRLTGNIRLKNLPVFAPMFPTLFNAAAVGAQVWFTSGDRTAVLFFTSALQTAAGELAVCTLLGLPLFRLVQKTGIFSKQTF